MTKCIGAGHGRDVQDGVVRPHGVSSFRRQFPRRVFGLVRVRIRVRWGIRDAGHTPSRSGRCGATDRQPHRRASQAAVAELDLSLTLESIRRVMDLAERSRLGGIPLFRPRHATSEVLPLYDFTNAGNLEELEELSGISLPRTFGREVSDEEALRLREAMRADERIEVREDTLSARRGVLALFGADVED